MELFILTAYLVDEKYLIGIFSTRLKAEKVEANIKGYDDFFFDIAVVSLDDNAEIELY